MVATVGKAASAAYYLESQRSHRPMTQYYVGGDEPDGHWYNPNALFDLVDGDRVDSIDFRQLYLGFDPTDDDIKLTQNAGSERRNPGIDITFGADKSVSALWAIAPRELREEIAKAHNDAARLALDEVIRKHCSWTRIVDKNGVIQVVPAEIIGATFQHGDSRAADPHLHTHCVLFNAVRAEDGKYRALHAKPIYRWHKAAGATYRHALAWYLQTRLGIRMERYGPADEFTRVVDMPDELIALWSKRRRDIVKTAADMGFETGADPARAAQLTLVSRGVKDHDHGGEFRHLRWDGEAEPIVGNRETLCAKLSGNDVTVSAEEIRAATERLAELPTQLTANEAVFRLPDIVERTANATACVFAPDATETSIARVLRNEEIVKLDVPTAPVRDGSASPVEADVRAGPSPTRRSIPRAPRSAWSTTWARWPPRSNAIRTWR